MCYLGKRAQVGSGGSLFTSCSSLAGPLAPTPTDQRGSAAHLVTLPKTEFSLGRGLPWPHHYISPLKAKAGITSDLLLLIYWKDETFWNAYSCGSQKLRYNNGKKQQRRKTGGKGGRKRDEPQKTCKNKNIGIKRLFFIPLTTCQDTTTFSFPVSSAISKFTKTIQIYIRKGARSPENKADEILASDGIKSLSGKSLKKRALSFLEWWTVILPKCKRKDRGQQHLAEGGCDRCQTHARLVPTHVHSRPVAGCEPKPVTLTVHPPHTGLLKVPRSLRLGGSEMLDLNL